jgi:hypothetical protein
VPLTVTSTIQLVCDGKTLRVCIEQISGGGSAFIAKCRRVLSDNGSSYRSGDWRKACQGLALKPIRTKPYTPQTNGKAERFIKTLLAE